MSPCFLVQAEFGSLEPAQRAGGIDSCAQGSLLPTCIGALNRSAQINFLIRNLATMN